MQIEQNGIKLQYVHILLLDHLMTKSTHFLHSRCTFQAPLFHGHITSTNAYTRKKIVSIVVFRIGNTEAHWTYFLQTLSNYNTKSLYHIQNSVIEALKSDIFLFYTCEINTRDIWL